MIVGLIPAYRAASTIVNVIKGALEYVDRVVVIDDACPQKSGDIVSAAFAADSRVIVLWRPTNGGVGSAIKTGLAKCLEINPDVIVKLDADGQMDPSFIPSICTMFDHNPNLGLVKGNRFVNDSVLSEMPKVRLFGNAALSLFAKFASGYWNLLDPTNGYIAFNGKLLPMLGWQRFANTYFFEISVLGELGLRQVPIGEVEMTSIYGEEQSSLSIRRVLWEFPPKLLRLFLRRITLQYFLFDVNLGSLYIFFGILMTIAGFAFGSLEWAETIVTHHARTAGTVMLAVLPILIGFQLLSNALMYDVQFAPKTLREMGTRAKGALHTVLLR